MAKKSKKPQKQKKEKEEKSLNQPWISMRKGIMIVAVASVAMAVLDRMAGDSIQRMVGRNSLGFALWRIDLAYFLWQHSD